VSVFLKEVEADMISHALCTITVLIVINFSKPLIVYVLLS